jgi:hypothetical protein
MRYMKYYGNMGELREPKIDLNRNRENLSTRVRPAIVNLNPEIRNSDERREQHWREKNLLDYVKGGLNENEYIVTYTSAWGVYANKGGHPAMETQVFRRTDGEDSYALSDPLITGPDNGSYVFIGDWVCETEDGYVVIIRNLGVGILANIEIEIIDISTDKGSTTYLDSFGSTLFNLDQVSPAKTDMLERMLEE